jgi:hypothetical protein
VATGGDERGLHKSAALAPRQPVPVSLYFPLLAPRGPIRPDGLITSSTFPVLFQETHTHTHPAPGRASAHNSQTLIKSSPRAPLPPLFHPMDGEMHWLEPEYWDAHEFVLEEGAAGAAGGASAAAARGARGGAPHPAGAPVAAGLDVPALDQVSRHQGRQDECVSTRIRERLQRPRGGFLSRLYFRRSTRQDFLGGVD